MSAIAVLEIHAAGSVQLCIILQPTNHRSTLVGVRRLCILTIPRINEHQPDRFTPCSLCPLLLPARGIDVAQPRQKTLLAGSHGSRRRSWTHPRVQRHHAGCLCLLIDAERHGDAIDERTLACSARGWYVQMCG